MDTRLGVDILSNSGRTRLHIDIMSKLKTPIGLVHETAREAGLHHYVIKSAICPRGRLVSIPQWWTKRAESDLVLAIDQTCSTTRAIIQTGIRFLPERVASRTWSSSPKAREDRPQPSIQYSGTTACRSGTQIGFVSGPWRARVCNRWRIDELRRQYKGVAQTSRDLYWPHPQR